MWLRMPRVDLPEVPQKSGPTLRSVVIVAGLLVFLVVPPLGGFFWLQHKSAIFALTLELKTKQGERDIRVVGTEVTLEERERRAAPVLHNCTMDLLDFYA